MNPQAPVSVEQGLRTLKTIVSSMAMGLVSLTGILIFLQTSRQPTANTDHANVLLLVLGLLGLSELPAYLILRAVFLNRLRRETEQNPPASDPTPKIQPIFFTLTLIGGALAEGWGLFGAIIYFLTGNWWALLAPALALVLLALQFPTRDKLAGFVSSATGRLWH